jgi:hypothetical protein
VRCYQLCFPFKCIHSMVHIHDGPAFDLSLQEIAGFIENVIKEKTDTQDSINKYANNASQP